MTIERISNETRQAKAGSFVLSLALLAVSSAAVNGAEGNDQIFHYDFSNLEIGSFPFDETGWSELSVGDGQALISEYEGVRAFTFDYPPDGHTRADYSFSPREEVELRFTIRFPSAVQVPDGYNTQLAPAVGLSAGSSVTSDPVLFIAFQDWGRIRMFYTHDGDLQETNYDSSTYEEIHNYHGQNRFDDPVELRLRYNRSTGLVALSGISDTESTQWEDYRITFQADPNMDFNQATIASSPFNNRSSPENFFQLGEISLYSIGAPSIGSYTDWVIAYLSDHPDEAGPFDDPGGFGVPNFARYAFALDPLRPHDSSVRGIHHLRDEGLVNLRFHRYEGIDDVVYRLETTVSLDGPWEQTVLDESNAGIVPLEDGREEVVVAFSDDAERKFARVRASLPELPEGTIFLEDFESYGPGETLSDDWIVGTPDDTAIFVDGVAGSRYLTMTDVNQDAVARVVRTFDTEGANSVSVTFEWYRKTGRAYNNHLGDELQWVPSFYLLQDVSDTVFWGSNIIGNLRLRSWDRGFWGVRDEFDSLTYGDVGSSDFLHDEPFQIRFTYRREGEVRIEVSKDGFETVEWSVVRDSVPDLDVNGFALGSSNTATSGTTRLYADPVWEVRFIEVSVSD